MYMTLIVEKKHEDMLGKYNKRWNKFKNFIKNMFDTEPVYNNQYLKTKMVCYENVIKAGYYELPSERSLCMARMLILIDSYIKCVSCDYYPIDWLWVLKCKWFENGNDYCHFFS